MPHQKKKINHYGARFWRKREYAPAVMKEARKQRRREICRIKKQKAREPKDPTKVCYYCGRHERQCTLIPRYKRAYHELMCWACAVVKDRTYDWFKNGGW